MAATQGAKAEGPEFDIKFRPVGGQLDTDKIYKWSEACSIRDTFVRMIIAHSGDPRSWFSAYQIQKTSWANANIGVLDREKLLGMSFESYEQVIAFMERMFKAMGYEVTRRETFHMVSTVPPEYLLADAGYMTSLLASEYEWENALKHFQTNGKEFRPSPYKIMQDEMFTPQPQVRRRLEVTQETMQAFEGDAIMKTVEKSVKKPTVQKTLDFDDVSSVDTTPDTKPKPKAKSSSQNVDNVAQGLLKLATDGDLSLDDAMSALRTLKVSRTAGKSVVDDDVQKPDKVDSDREGSKARVTKTTSKKSKSAKKSAKDSASDRGETTSDGGDSDRIRRSAEKTKKKSRTRVDVTQETSSDEESDSDRTRRSARKAKKQVRILVESSSEDDGDSDSDSEEEVKSSKKSRTTSKSSSGRHVTTVLENVQIPTFDGRNRSPEEATQWLSKFNHAANLSNWTNQQRLETFVNNLGGPVRFWYKQLPRSTRKDWKECLKSFRKRYCKEALSAHRSYFNKTWQRQDEKPVDYLYRLNAAAIKAGIDYNNDDDDLHDHIELNFDTAAEKTMPAQLRYRKFESVNELEEVLLQHDVTTSRDTKKVTFQPAAQTPAQSQKTEKPRQEPRVNALEALSQSTQGFAQHQTLSPTQAQFSQDSQAS